MALPPLDVLFRNGGLLILSILVTMGCVSQPGIENSQVTPTNATIATMTIQVDDVSTPTTTIPATSLLSTATLTLTPTPTLAPIVEIVETVSPTNTTSPTLSVEQEAILLSALMTSNDECNLLCWWSVIPGETSQGAAREMFAAKGIDDWVVSFDETYAIIGLGYGTPDSSSFTRDVIVQFGLENDLIQYIIVEGGGREDQRSIFVRDWQSYGPAQLLNQHGMPSYVEFIEVENSPYYRLVLSYEELGIEINYTTLLEPIENGQEKICFNLEKIDFIGLTLYPPGNASDVPFNIIPNRLDNYTSWESTTGLSLETFQELFNDSNTTPCIEVN